MKSIEVVVVMYACTVIFFTLTFQTSSWVAVLFLFVVAVVSIGRTVLWVRKLRRERKWNVSAGLVNSEVPSSTYEEVDKTPAAI